MNAFSNSQTLPDGLAMADAIRKGHMTPKEAAAEALDRMRHVNPQLNALVDDLGEEALRTAGTTSSDGVFAGVPTLVKDLFMPVKGARMTNGSLVTAQAVAPFDAEVITRGRATGITILGTTTSPEFGTSYTTESRLSGATANPWSLEHTAGGSSGGSAAMVAARVVPFAFGNDGGGSLRVPASCCGVFGLKPTRGRVPMGPVIGEGWAGMGCNHIISLSVRDSAAMLDALSGMEIGAPYAAPQDAASLLSNVGRPPERLRIGLIRELPPFKAEVQCIAAVEDAARLCIDLGHDVEETSFPVEGLEFYDKVFTIIGAQTRSFVDMLGEIMGAPVNSADLEPRTRIILREKGDVSGAAYAAAIDWIHAFGRRMAHLTERYDVLLSPTLAKTPQPLGSFTLRDENRLEQLIALYHSFSPITALFNASGQPAMSVPIYWSEHGLPVGSHFAAGFGKEAILFALAGQLETARPWAHRVPPVAARL